MISGNTLKSEIVFPVMGLFGILKLGMAQIPDLIGGIIESKISLIRIQDFLQHKDQNDIYIEYIQKHSNQSIQQENYVILIKNIKFYWNYPEIENNMEKQKLSLKSDNELLEILNKNQEEEEQNLKNYILDIQSLKIKQNQLIGIIGDIGQGKSSFLQALQGEMINEHYSKNSNFQIIGKIGYIGQNPWLLNDTIKNNILLGKEFDKTLYNECLYYSCLQDDLELFQNKDEHFINFRGQNLSGGQKVRLQLARSLYQKPDIYLFDDILSALDINVGIQILNNCILNYLKNKTVLFATHSQYVIEKLQNILKIENKEIKPINIQEKNQILPQIQYQKKSINEIQTEKINKKVIINNNNLQEDRKEGQISYQVIKEYIKLNGKTSFILKVVLTTFGSQFFVIVSNIYLAYWMQQNEQQNTVNQYQCYQIYIILAFGAPLMHLLRYIFLDFSNLKAVKILQQNIIQRILHAPIIQYFDKTPLGRIINYVSKDLYIIDTVLPHSLGNFIVGFFSILKTIFLCVYSSNSYIIFIPATIYFIISVKIYIFYIQPCREIQRLQSISMTPVLSFFQESLEGLVHIRSNKLQNQFQQKYCYLIDENKKNQILIELSNIWFQLNIECFSLMVNITSIILCVFYTSNEQSSLVGLSLTQAITLESNIFYTLNELASFETKLISFERCNQLSNIPQEKDPINSKIKQNLQQNQEQNDSNDTSQQQLMNQNDSIQQNQQNAIEFKNVSAFYTHQNYVLKNLSFQIKKNEKIAIIGRTGSGKSSILQLLLQFLQHQQGQIYVNGQNIKNYSLKQLRQQYSVIMQDSQIIEGSLKDNLDPIQNFSQKFIDNKLDQYGIKDLIYTLNTNIEENGINLSQGQQQLIQLARTILKDKDIILIDEGTSNIDQKIEKQINNIILQKFKNKTVLNIIHKLNNVLEYDRVLVLQKGEILEFNNPKKLLKEENSIFAKMYTKFINEGSQN